MAAPNLRRTETSAVPETIEQEPKRPRQELIENIKTGLQWRYKRETDTVLPSKLTATELKGGFAAAEAAEEAEKLPPRSFTPSLRRPAFALEKEGLSPTERGTALHIVMQYINYSRCKT